MEPPALPAGPAAPVRAAPGASASILLPLPEGTPPFTYTWSRAGAALDERFTSSQEAGGVRLTVASASVGDTGLYTLQARNAAGTATSSVRLEVGEEPSGEDPPAFLRRLQDLTVKVGSRTRFLVEILSSTDCKVTWYRNERRLLEAERVSLARDGCFWCADVAAVSVEDAGRWTCSAENAGGRASCSAHLNVLVPKAYKRPEFVEELQALLTEQGTVSLECKVVGVPTPVLRWFKDSREIKAGDVFALTANAEDPTSLGTYTCEAVNCMGRAYSSSKVHVVGRSREGSARPSSSGMPPEAPPIFTKELEDAHVKICERLTLGCHVVVPPWPRSVVWYNKEGKLEPGDRYQVLEDGVGGYLLEISSTEWADEGEWKCVATSAGGRVGISTCYVTMDVPKNYRKPRFMENLQAVLTEEGLVSFECKVVGFPTPVLSWFKDGQELKPGDVYQLTGTNSLGSYCCIARNCMGQASSSAELTVEDIQNQLNEEEKLQLFSKNQAPKFIQGLKSVEAKIDEPFRFTVKVAIPPEPSVLWYRDDQPVDESTRCHLEKEDKGVFNIDIQNLEFLDQAEWKCVAMNDFGHSVTSCFLKLIIPRHYKKPRFLENLQAILSDEGAVNLECKVIGVPQPVLKWYKDGEELKPGDIHRIISGQDGTCCLGTYTCEAQNCMGIAASSASLLGFDDSIKTKPKKTEEQPLQRQLSLSTIHEERTSQMYDTPVGDITIDDKGEISFSFDGKEVSVSLYETPDLTEEEALQIVEMYADQLSENVTEHNVVELPPLRFVKETSTSGNLLMEAIIIDVSPDYFAVPEEDLRTEADVEDLSIADENGPPMLSLDQDIEIGGEDYLENTMALLSDEKSDLAAKYSRKKSDSQRSGDDFFSLSRDQSLSEEKRDDDTNISESDLQSFASARSSAKMKSKSSKPSAEECQESSEPTKTILLKDDVKLSKEKLIKESENELEVPVAKPKRERRSSRGSRRSSTSSEKSISKSKEELLRTKSEVEHSPKMPLLNDNDLKYIMNNISTSLTKVINDVQLIERDIILKSELMSSAATASRSLEIINSLISPLSEIHSIADATKESISESREITSTIFNSIPKPLKTLQQSLTIIEKCIDVESDNKTLVKRTCVSFIESCGLEVQKIISDIASIAAKNYFKTENKVINEIECMTNEITSVIKFSFDTIQTKSLLTEASEIKHEEPTLETKHLRDTQRAVFELKGPLNSLLRIVENAECSKASDLTTIKDSEVIMNDMSASIQDLQTALEQIESLSVIETSSMLQKYNIEIIETVMDPVLRLRESFEKLSTETKTKEGHIVFKETLATLKENLTEISRKIETVDDNIGQFDVLQSDNKLDVLQKMAQILIAFENNLPVLETIPDLKSHMDTFHKNLTKVLEKVIESNDAKKYLTMIEICDTVNILNSSIKNLDADNVLPLASICNTLKIIQTYFVTNIFDSELNCSIMNNISDILVDIHIAINKAEEKSLQVDSECIQELSTHVIGEEVVKIVLEHIDKTIAAVEIIKTIETTKELQSALSTVLENISPILEELRESVGSIRSSGVEQEEHASEISEISFAQTIASPLCELNQNLIVLNQFIVENIDMMKEYSEVITAIAEPLHELHTTLEIIQQDVISQYRDALTPYEVSVNMASVVQNLQSCIVMIHEQTGVEAADEMSTLEDISGIKTSADTLPSDRLVLPTAEETTIEQSLPPLVQEVAITATALTLQTLNEHIMVLQTPEVIETLDVLSQVSDYSSLKTIGVGLGDLHTGLEGILHPVPIEGSIDLEHISNIPGLAAIAEPMQDLHQSLSVLDTSNIPVYESFLDLPSEKIHSVIKNISEFKSCLEQCISALFPAMEIATNTIEISSKVSTLREVCEQLKEIFETSRYAPTQMALSPEVHNLELVVESLIDATDASKNIKIEQVRCITEELYLKVKEVQEDLIQFTAQTPEKLSQEAKLIQIVCDVETNIAVLEQYDFIDLTRASDITACASPQFAVEIDSESLVQIHDIAEHAVNVLQDSYQEIPLADLMIVEDFFKTCKNEFTILRCLITKAITHKKIIRLLQEFCSLQTMINNFTTKRLELILSDDVNECLTDFLIHADECLRNVRSSLIKVIDSQTTLLIEAPVAALESIQEVNNDLNQTNSAIATVVNSLFVVANTSKPLTTTLHRDIINELLNPNQILSPNEDEISLCANIEEISTIIETQINSGNNEEITHKVLQRLSECIHKHHDYKDAIGKGKILIILKCLADCVNIVQNTVADSNISKDEETKKNLEENSLNEVLAEMIKPLQALQTQLINIQEQVLSGAEEDTISIDITSTESIMQSMNELHKDIVQQIESEKVTVDHKSVSLIKEEDKEIHSIQDSIKSMENIDAAKAIKEITKPMENIENTLHDVLPSEEHILHNETLSNEKAGELLDHIDQYIELQEITKEIAAIINDEDMNETFDIARELRENIAITEGSLDNEQHPEKIITAQEEQTKLAEKLIKALSNLQSQVLENIQEVSLLPETDALQVIAKVTTQLQDKLLAVTGVQLPVVQTHAPCIETVTSVDSIEQSTSNELIGANIIESIKSDKKVPIEDITQLLQNTQTTVVQADTYMQSTDAAEKVSNIPTQTLPENVSEKCEEFAIKSVQDEPMKELENSSISTDNHGDIVTHTREIPEGTTQIHSLNNLVTARVSESTLTKSDNIEVKEKLEEDILKPRQQQIEKIETILTTQGDLMRHINEYVSDDIVEVVNQLSKLMNCEELKASVSLAKELRDSITASETESNEVIIGDSQSIVHVNLVDNLENSLSVLSEQTFEALHKLIPSAKKDILEKVMTTTHSLKTYIASINTSQGESQGSLNSLELKTQLTTDQLENESAPIKISIADVRDDHLPNLERTELVKQDTGVEHHDTFMQDQEKDAQSSKSNAINASIVIEAKESQQLDVDQELLLESKLTEESGLLEPSHTTVIATHDGLNEQVIIEQKNVLESALPILVTGESRMPPMQTASIGEEANGVAKTAVVDLTLAAEETSGDLKAKGIIERKTLLQHINAFITDEITEIVNAISNISNIESLKESVFVAKKLHESIMATDCSATAEEVSDFQDGGLLEQALLAQILQDSLSILHTQALSSAEIIEPVLAPNSLQKVSEIISVLQEDLARETASRTSAICTVHAASDSELEQYDSMAQLKMLLQDVNSKLIYTYSDGLIDFEDSEALKDTLDEVQTVIIKLKRDYDGAANDTLNETLEDLECSVRSVQLQINEVSPPELLTEACATLQLLVENMNSFQLKVSESTLKPQNTQNITEKCSNDIEETINLIDLAAKLPESNRMENIVSKLKIIKDSMKSLRETFVADVDTVIECGVSVIETLEELEENIFSLEKEIDSEKNLPLDVRDNIITAVHSVYGSISNMRSTVSSVQKRFMFENYGKPSESLLHAIKNIAVISSSENEVEKQDNWKKLSKSIRKVIIHFEDVKFYINLDKTARLPSDAAFTKIILEELKNNIINVLQPRAILMGTDVHQSVEDTLKCVESNLTQIEPNTSLEVKNKIPMFKDIANKMLNTTNIIRNRIQIIPDTETEDAKESQEKYSTFTVQQISNDSDMISSTIDTIISEKVESFPLPNLLFNTETLLAQAEQSTLVDVQVENSILGVEPVKSLEKTQDNLQENTDLNIQNQQTDAGVQAVEKIEFDLAQISQGTMQSLDIDSMSSVQQISNDDDMLSRATDSIVSQEAEALPLPNLFFNTETSLAEPEQSTFVDVQVESSILGVEPVESLEKTQDNLQENTDLNIQNQQTDAGVQAVEKIEFDQAQISQGTMNSLDIDSMSSVQQISNDDDMLSRATNSIVSQEAEALPLPNLLFNTETSLAEAEQSTLVDVQPDSSILGTQPEKSLEITQDNLQEDTDVNIKNQQTDAGVQNSEKIELGLAPIPQGTMQSVDIESLSSVQQTSSDNDMLSRATDSIVSQVAESLPSPNLLFNTETSLAEAEQSTPVDVQADSSILGTQPEKSLEKTQDNLQEDTDVNIKNQQTDEGVQDGEKIELGLAPISQGTMQSVDIESLSSAQQTSSDNDMLSRATDSIVSQVAESLPSPNLLFNTETSLAEAEQSTPVDVQADSSILGTQPEKSLEKTQDNLQEDTDVNIKNQQTDEGVQDGEKIELGLAPISQGTMQSVDIESLSSAQQTSSDNDMLSRATDSIVSQVAESLPSPNLLFNTETSLAEAEQSTLVDVQAESSILGTEPEKSLEKRQGILQEDTDVNIENQQTDAGVQDGEKIELGLAPISQGTMQSVDIESLSSAQQTSSDNDMLSRATDSIVSQVAESLPSPNLLFNTETSLAEAEQSTIVDVQAESSILGTEPEKSLEKRQGNLQEDTDVNIEIQQTDANVQAIDKMELDQAQISQGTMQSLEIDFMSSVQQIVNDNDTMLSRATDSIVSQEAESLPSPNLLFNTETLLAQAEQSTFVDVQAESSILRKEKTEKPKDILQENTVSNIEYQQTDEDVLATEKNELDQTQVIVVEMSKKENQAEIVIPVVNVVKDDEILCIPVDTMPMQVKSEEDKITKAEQDESDSSEQIVSCSEANVVHAVSNEADHILQVQDKPEEKNDSFSIDNSNELALEEKEQLCDKTESAAENPDEISSVTDADEMKTELQEKQQSSYSAQNESSLEYNEDIEIDNLIHKKEEEHSLNAKTDSKKVEKVNENIELKRKIEITCSEEQNVKKVNEQADVKQKTEQICQILEKKAKKVVIPGVENEADNKITEVDKEEEKPSMSQKVEIFQKTTNDEIKAAEKEVCIPKQKDEKDVATTSKEAPQTIKIENVLEEKQKTQWVRQDEEVQTLAAKIDEFEAAKDANLTQIEQVANMSTKNEAHLRNKEKELGQESDTATLVESNQSYKTYEKAKTGAEHKISEKEAVLIEKDKNAMKDSEAAKYNKNEKQIKVTETRAISKDEELSHMECEVTKKTKDEPNLQKDEEQNKIYSVKSYEVDLTKNEQSTQEEKQTHLQRAVADEKARSEKDEDLKKQLAIKKEGPEDLYKKEIADKLKLEANSMGKIRIVTENENKASNEDKEEVDQRDVIVSEKYDSGTSTKNENDDDENTCTKANFKKPEAKLQYDEIRGKKIEQENKTNTETIKDAKEKGLQKEKEAPAKKETEAIEKLKETTDVENNETTTELEQVRQKGIKEKKRLQKDSSQKKALHETEIDVIEKNKESADVKVNTEDFSQKEEKDKFDAIAKEKHEVAEKRTEAAEQMKREELTGKSSVAKDTEVLENIIDKKNKATEIIKKSNKLLEKENVEHDKKENEGAKNAEDVALLRDREDNIILQNEKDSHIEEFKQENKTIEEAKEAVEQKDEKEEKEHLHMGKSEKKYEVIEKTKVDTDVDEDQKKDRLKKEQNGYIAIAQKENETAQEAKEAADQMKIEEKPCLPEINNDHKECIDKRNKAAEITKEADDVLEKAKLENEEIAKEENKAAKKAEDAAILRDKEENVRQKEKEDAAKQESETVEKDKEAVDRINIEIKLQMENDEKDKVEKAAADLKEKKESEAGKKSTQGMSVNKDENSQLKKENVALSEEKNKTTEKAKKTSDLKMKKQKSSIKEESQDHENENDKKKPATEQIKDEFKQKKDDKEKQLDTQKNMETLNQKIMETVENANIDNEHKEANEIASIKKEELSVSKMTKENLRYLNDTDELQEIEEKRQIKKVVLVDDAGKTNAPVKKINQEGNQDKKKQENDMLQIQKDKEDTLTRIQNKKDTEEIEPKNIDEKERRRKENTQAIRGKKSKEHKVNSTESIDKSESTHFLKETEKKETVLNKQNEAAETVQKVEPKILEETINLQKEREGHEFTKNNTKTLKRDKAFEEKQKKDEEEDLHYKKENRRQSKQDKVVTIKQEKNEIEFQLNQKESVYSTCVPPVEYVASDSTREVNITNEKCRNNIDLDSISSNNSYTGRFDVGRNQDDEHTIKKNTYDTSEKGNGDSSYRKHREVSHDEHYIKEYQYVPAHAGPKLETRDKLRFVDHNHRDYTMEFARPTGYRERSFNVDQSESLPLHDHLGRNTTIYKAQTIVLDSALRSSGSPYHESTPSRMSEPRERREIRHKFKALSEARSTTSEMRAGSSRDSKRKPVLSTSLTDRTAVEGSRVKLTCSVLSSSDPKVTWYKNGVLLDNKLKYRIKAVDGLITLEVLNAVPSDSAEYSCTIENDNGAVNSSATLKVYPSFEASPIPPTFTRSIRDTYHLAENELVLECRIRGQPLPTITWLKDDKSINDSRYQACYLADGVCRLAIESPTPGDSGKYTCKAENSVWSDQITHIVNFTGNESRLSPNIATIEKSRLNRQAMESRRPHFTNVLADYKVVKGGTIGLQVEIKGAPTRVEWLREGSSVTEVYRNAKTFVEQGLYTLALSDVTEKESGMYTCRAWSSHGNVDMNAAITVVQPTELEGKPAIIVGRPEKDILISVGEDINISFRVQGEPKPKVIFMKGIRDITTSQRVCKMTSDDYVKFTLKRSVIADAGTYCVFVRNAYGCDRAFVTVVVRQRASSDNLISDWTYPADDSSNSVADRKYKSVPERIPGEPRVFEGGNNWISLGWPKSEPGPSGPVLAYKVESWLLGKEGGARWTELGITPLNSFDVFNLKQGEEYHFRITPRNRYGWGESAQTTSAIGVGAPGERPEFAESLPGQLKVLVGETAHLACSVRGKPTPDVVWMKNGHEIEDEDRRVSSSYNGFECSLTIADVAAEDEARYSCEATNVHGRASTYARVAVVTDRSIWEADAKLKRERSADVEGDFPPQFTMRLRDRRVQATYPVRLTCQVIGSPDPGITWFKDGEEVVPDSRRSHFQDEHFHTLEIAPTTLDDGGVYEAMARNSSGAVSCRCNLVVDKGIRAYVAPEFCCGLEPLYRLTDGEELRISAVVEAYPSVGVTWYRDGVRLRPSRRAIMTLDRDGQIELALAAVTSRDAGVYTCTASNEVGRASTSGKVEVIGESVKRPPPMLISPDVPYSKEPMFIRKPRSSEAREGDTVIIECEVVGDPKPEVYWLRDFLKPDYYRDACHFKRLGDGPHYRFEIPHAKLDYTGAYSVVARNPHGETKAVISLQILARDPSASEEHNVRYGRVEVLPRFEKEPRSLLTCDGDAVEFHCCVSGHPEPDVRWFHENELVRDSSDFETSFEAGEARLRIRQVTQEDEGTYTCEAANTLGKATCTACLVVYPAVEPNTLSQRQRRPPALRSAASTPRSTPRTTPARCPSTPPVPERESRRLCSPARTAAPAFYTYPHHRVVTEGDSVVMQCGVKGNPAPWASWDKDGVLVAPSARITIKEKECLRILEIDKVTTDDVGVYRITVENELGRAETSARLEVITRTGKFCSGVRLDSPAVKRPARFRRRPPSPADDGRYYKVKRLS